MSTQRKLRRGTSAEFASFTPVEGELCYDTTNKRSVQGDGVRVGGIPTPNFYDVQNQAFTYAAASGTNTVTVTLGEAPSAYAAGQSFKFKAAATNTSTVTLNVNSLGAKNIKKMGSSGKENLAAGDIVSGGIYTVDYDGTDFIVSGGIGSQGVGLVVLAKSGATPGTAAIQFDDLSSDYSQYIIYIGAMLASANNQQLQLQYSTDNGLSFKTSGYRYAVTFHDEDDVSSSVVHTSNTVIGLTPQTSSSSNPISGWVMIHRPYVSGITTASWQLTMIDSGGDVQVISGSGTRGTAEAVNSIRFIMSSTTLDDGEFVLCGVANP